MKAKKKVRKLNKISIVIVLVLFIVVTTIIIYAKNIQPTSEATTETISVTYKVGDGMCIDSDGNVLETESVTYSETIYDSGTQGTNDYTDNKIILRTSSELGFTHESTTYNDLEYEMVLTGWKLTSVTQNGTVITTYVEPENQNYADPTDAAKDIDTVYAQNGWYIVPDGVTSITVEAVYGRAIYIRSPYDTMYYDEYHIFYYGENDDGTTSLDGTATAYSSDSNYGTSEDDAVATLKRAYELIDSDSNATVYDTVIVLCGDLYEINYRTSGKSYIDSAAEENYQAYSNTSWGYNTSTTKPMTITSLSSITGDSNDRYNLYMKAQGYDFYFYSSVVMDDVQICSLSTSQIQDIHGTSVGVSTYTRSRQLYLYGEGISFETTENTTSDGSTNIWLYKGNHFKLNGGKYGVQWKYSNSNYTLNEGTYIQIGGLAYMTFVSNGVYANSTTSEYIYTNPPKIIVTGGSFSTGIYGTSYVAGGSVKGDVYIYISGGYIANIYGGGNGSVYANGSENGNVNILIYGGTIGTIYGGGQYYTSTISGDVNINIENATITGNIYGGGKGGKINGSVNLSIDNCNISGTVFGGGLGLTDTVTMTVAMKQTADSTYETTISSFNTVAASVGTVNWDEAPIGFPIYDTENTLVVTRRYHSASYSSAQITLREYEVTSMLTLSEVYGNVNLDIANSSISGDVYGGGSIAIVYGDIDLNISNSTVGGNIYGGGDGVTTPSTVTLYKPINSDDYTQLLDPSTNGTQNDSNTSIGSFTWTNDVGILTYFAGIYDGANAVVYNEDGTTTSFDTIVATYGEEAKAVIDTYGTSKLVYSADRDNLGMVDGNITLTITDVSLESDASVYGGGNNGTTNGSTTIIISNTDFDTLFGGGNSGDVNENCNITVNNSEISTIYGGSNAGDVEGDCNIEIVNATITTLYGGGNSGNISGSCSNEITNSTIGTIYGGSNEGNVDGETSVIVNSGTYENIFGGGNLGYVTGNTTVIVGNESDLGVTVTGLVYGGGKGYDEDGDGDASDFTTVYGTSEVTIQGINTNVENYGSIKLGMVEGDVNVTFLNYWTGNGTAKYKTMNGIDRATTVTFTNSYVLLENVNSDGELEGISDIVNLIIPDGSGLKISADGEISGNFEGGGELYFDSRVCLTVGGDLSGVTTLVLNPLIEEDENLIKGGIEYPYMIVEGTVEDGADLVSGSSKYVILNDVVEEATYYYIEKDVVISGEITITSVNVADKIYNGEVTNASDVNIYGYGTYTTEIDIDYSVSTDEETLENYENLSREFVIKSSLDNVATVIPAGTSIVLIYDGEYYFYNAKSDITEVALAEFTNISGESFSEIANIKTADGVTIEENETTELTNYFYTETYRLILDFENSVSQLLSGYYYMAIEISDSEESLEDEETENATNVVQIYNREYSYDYELSKAEYENNETVEISGTLSLSSTPNEEEQSEKDLHAKIELLDSEENVVEIPIGTVISVNENECTVFGQSANSLIIENLSNDEISKSLDISINMKNVISQNLLDAGEYTVKVEFVLAQNGYIENTVQGTETVSIALIIYESGNYGINASVDISENSNMQLIESGTEESKTITLEYNVETLEDVYVKIETLEKTGVFTYEETDESDLISVKIGEAEVLTYSLEESGNIEITAEFSSKIDVGTYRIYFELYDKYGTKLTEDFVGFIVK